VALVKLNFSFLLINLDQDIFRTVPAKPLRKEWTGFLKVLLPVGFIYCKFLGSLELGELG
jgi:hypothetical protein